MEEPLTSCFCQEREHAQIFFSNLSNRCCVCSAALLQEVPLSCRSSRGCREAADEPLKAEP